MPTSAKDIVDCVIAGLDSGDSDEVISERLHLLGLGNDQAINAIELVRSGFCRALFLSAGMGSDQCGSHFVKNPIFLAAIDEATHRIESQLPPELKTFSQLECDLDSTDAQARQTAAYNLGQSHNAAAIPLLKNMLHDPDEFVRINVIQALSALTAIDAVPNLCVLLATERNGRILSNLITALARIGDRSAVPALIQATNDPDAFVRYDSAWALGQLRDSRARSALKGLLADETYPLELDQYGLPKKSTSIRVCDQAQKSLNQLDETVRPWWRFW